MMKGDRHEAALRIYYDSEDYVAVDREKANIVKLIYRQYLSGMSLGGIADFLYQQGIPSPTGRERWTQPVISDLLSKKKYIGAIISFDEYFMVQGEKGNRSNIDEDTKQRKTTRYSSQSVLSGLLICAECERHYRRITRPSGKVVWRCANRVGYGKKFCKYSSSIQRKLLRLLFAKTQVWKSLISRPKGPVDYLAVQQDGTLWIELQQHRLYQILG